MNDELPSLPSIDFDEFDKFESQISVEEVKEELSKELGRSIPRRQVKQMRKKKNYSNLLALVLLFVFVAGFSYLAINGESDSFINNEKQTSNNKENLADAEVKGIQSNRTFNLNSSNKIAYISSGNVWIVDYDGKDKTQITTDGGLLKTYKNVEWKNSRELSFTACSNGECKIFLFNLVNDSTAEVLSLQVPQINSLKWSPNSDVLLVSYVKPNGVFENMMWKNNVQTILRSYYIDQNVVTDFNDEISFSFSEDGQYFAAINTLVNSSAEDQVIIYDLNANQIATISGETSFAVFSKANNIYFKNDNKVFRGKIGSIQSQLILDSFNKFDLHLSKDSNIMTFWSLNADVPVSSFYNLSTGELKDFGFGVKSPKWLNENFIIGLQVQNYKGLYAYELQKLASVDIVGNVRVIEENNVSEFDVEGI